MTVLQNVSKSIPSEAHIPAPFYRQKNEAQRGLPVNQRQSQDLNQGISQSEDSG